MDECDHDFEVIKRQLAEPPILGNLKAREELYMYLVVLDIAISIVLFRHNQSNEHRPVYYMSKSFDRHKNMIFPSGTNNPSIADRHQKASSILSSIPNNDLDKSTVRGHVAQAKSILTNDEIGDRIE